MKTDDRPSVDAGQILGGPEIDVGLLTGGQDRHYAFGLTMAVVSKGACVDFIGADEVDSPELHRTPGVKFLNLRGNQRHDAGLVTKISRVLMYYARLIRYTAIAKPKVFHILWNNKFEIFDRTLLMLYYKLMGKKIAFTAHNVNAGQRDATDTLLNRLTLRIQYRLADHIFVHTEKMKRGLLEEFGVPEPHVTVLAHPINVGVPDTGLSSDEAKRRLGIRPTEKTLLFFGAIAPYKGVEHLIAAFQSLVARREEYRLIITGRPKKNCETYWHAIEQTITRYERERIIQRIEYIPDQEMEPYLKAADVLILPYTDIFQSGVLFLAYSFGLPVIATDVGSMRENIVEGKTGYVCRPADSADLAHTIETYFAGDLFKCSNRRQEIQEWARTHHSWDTAGQTVRNVYAELLISKEGSRCSERRAGARERAHADRC
jgi:glycosyltransferase involved in cell wall biosynthesis